MDSRTLIVVVAVGLLVACILYAWFLDGIHDKYTPDKVHWTVVGGELIVLLAEAALAWSAALAWWGWEDVAVAFGAQAIAGMPILYWQGVQNRRRRNLRDGVPSNHEGSNRHGKHPGRN